MRDFRPVGIDALVLGDETDAGNAELVNLLLLLRRDLALEPDEAALGRKPLAQFACVEIRQNSGEQLRRLVDIDDLARLTEERRRAHIGCENFTVAVKDVGPRSGDRVRAGASRALAVGCRQHHQPRGNHRVNERKGQNCQPNARARPRVAVDIGTEKKALDQPPRRRRGLLLSCLSERCVHRRAFGGLPTPLVGISESIMNSPPPGVASGVGLSGS